MLRAFQSPKAVFTTGEDDVKASFIVEEPKTTTTTEAPINTERSEPVSAFLHRPVASPGSIFKLSSAKVHSQPHTSAVIS